MAKLNRNARAAFLLMCEDSDSDPEQEEKALTDDEILEMNAEFSKRPMDDAYTFFIKGAFGA